MTQIQLGWIDYAILLVYFALQHVHWRTAFLLFGLLGVGWAAAFFAWYRDDPRDHPAVNAAEAALVPASAPPSSTTTEPPDAR